MINVLHIMDYNGVFGGLYLFLRRISNLLGPKGIEFNYLARTAPPYDNKEVLNEFDVPSAEEIDVYKYVSDISPDIIHFHDYLEKEQMQWCIDRYPTIRTFHDNYTFCTYGFYKNGRLCYNDSVSHCVKSGCITKQKAKEVQAYLDLQKKMNLITCFSNNIKEKCLLYGFEENKVIKIPTLLEQTKGVECVDDMPDKNIIMYAGRIVETKGIEYIIRSLIKIKDLDWKLVLVGTGEKKYVQKLLGICMKEKIMDKVCFKGFLEHDKYIEMLSRAKVFIFSSLAPEGYGYTGAEAMLYGIPIIAFGVDGVEEWLENNYNGFIVPTEDIESMSKSISLLLYDIEEWKRIKKNAIERRKKLMKIEKQIEILYRMYVQLV